MTQGRARTPKTESLGQIFFHIRTERHGPVRRSWQRRGRIALQKQHPELTPAERHEIMVCWSRYDCDRIESPALRKIHPNLKSLIPKHDWETKKARRFMRAGFDSDGQPTRKKKPGVTRQFSDAANDPIYLPSTTSHSQCTPLHFAGPDTRVIGAALVEPLSLHHPSGSTPAASNGGSEPRHAAQSSTQLRRVKAQLRRRSRSQVMRWSTRPLLRTEPRTGRRRGRSRALIL